MSQKEACHPIASGHCPRTSRMSQEKARQPVASGRCLRTHGTLSWRRRSLQQQRALKRTFWEEAGPTPWLRAHLFPVEALEL